MFMQQCLTFENIYTHFIYKIFKMNKNEHLQLSELLSQ